MDKKLSSLFHRYSKHVLFGLHTPADWNEWPEEWKEVYYKQYPRLGRYALPQPNLPPISFEATLARRESDRHLSRERQISLDELSTILHYGAGLKGEEQKPNRRFYPSGGARYPLEVYVATVGYPDLPEGIYHYHVPSHSLERIGDEHYSQELISKGLTYAFSKQAPTVLFISAIWERNFVKYKDFGYPVVLLEAGHVGQNFHLLAAALGLKSCPSAGFRIDEICAILDLDPNVEAPVHTILLGK